MINSNKKYQNSKISVAYEDIPDQLLKDFKYDHYGVVCETCSFWEDPNKCTVVSGKISPQGCCILYAWDGKVNMSFISGEEAAVKIFKKKEKLTKKEAGYLTPLPPKLRSPLGNDQASFGCHSCFYFDQKNGVGSCGLVKGRISVGACCNLWSYTELKPSDLKYAKGSDLKMPPNSFEF